MQIEVVETRGATTVVIEGRVDSATASDLHEVLDEVVRSGATHLVIDLEAVDHLSSAGLREFMAVLKRLNDIRLASPSERIRDLLEISGLDSVLAVYETRQDAVSSF